jgi:uncharacterized protein (TIGR00369 family)
MAAVLVEEGPWKGWRAWHARPEGRFVDGMGDVFYRYDAPEVRAAIETAHRHANGLGYLHGGFLMAFVDVAMMAVARAALELPAAVTLNSSVDFLGPGTIGKPLYSTGRIVKETGKLVWVAGLLTQDDGESVVCQWHGMLRKVSRRR